MYAQYHFLVSENQKKASTLESNIKEKNNFLIKNK
jgi:hypothetical protein